MGALVIAMQSYAMAMHRGGRITKRTIIRNTRPDFLHIAHKFGQSGQTIGSNRTPSTLSSPPARPGRICRPNRYAPGMHTGADA